MNPVDLLAYCFNINRCRIHARNLKARYGCAEAAWDCRKTHKRIQSKFSRRLENAKGTSEKPLLKGHGFVTLLAIWLTFVLISSE